MPCRRSADRLFAGVVTRFVKESVVCHSRSETESKQVEEVYLSEILAGSIRTIPPAPVNQSLAIGSLNYSPSRQCFWKTVERVEDAILNAMGGIIQYSLHFGCWDLECATALNQPQTSIGSLLNSKNLSECFGIRRDNPPESISVEVGQSQFSSNPYMSPPTLNCIHASNLRIIGGKIHSGCHSFSRV